MTGLADLSGDPLRIHVVGAGGAGMGAIAAVLHAMGHQVSGSDLKSSPVVERLRAAGVQVTIGHDPAVVCDVDLVTVSTAIPPTNPEVVAAVEAGVPVLRRSQILAAICATRETVAVAGTHGKTTTSSMLALVLRAAGLDPGFIIGGEVNEIGGGAGWGSGTHFVVEADESDGTFLELPRSAAVVTNVEPDHLEHYGGFEPLREAFVRFIDETPGPVVVCVDDANAAALAAPTAALTYGLSEDADYQIVGLTTTRSGSRWSIRHRGVVLGDLSLPVPGLHNASNATAAAVMALQLGANFDQISDALGRYGGVARRFEYRGEAAGVTFIDDYAHLPTEVAAVLDAVRRGGWDRIVAVFQPHRYSRTQALWRDFGECFEGADLLVLTDVYPAGEPPRPGVTGELILRAVLEAHPWRRVAYLPRREELIAYLGAELRPGDVCVTLGAGDLTSLPDALLARLGPP
jgi:UDP-N-acetylmuramate--alanine ligase